MIEKKGIGESLCPFYVGAGGGFEAKQLLLFTLALSLCDALAVCAVDVTSLTLVKEVTKKARGGFAPQPQGARRELSIFPPRGKNVYLHFSSVAKMTFANLIFASGNPKISLLQRHIDVPLPFGKRFLRHTSPFLLCEGCVRPESGIDAQPNPSWRRCRTRRSICTCPHL